MVQLANDAAIKVSTNTADEFEEQWKKIGSKAQQKFDQLADKDHLLHGPELSQ